MANKKKYKVYISVGWDFIVSAADEDEAEEKARELYAKTIGSIVETELFSDPKVEVEGRDF